MSGPWGGAYDVFKPDVISLHLRPYTWKLGDRIFQTRQDNTTIFFKGGVDCPKDSTLKISGALVGAFDISEPDDHKNENGGGGISQTRQDNITIFLQRCRLSQRLSGRGVGAFDVSELDVFPLDIRTYTWKWGDRSDDFSLHRRPYTWKWGDRTSESREYIFTWVVICPLSPSPNVLVTIHTVRYFVLQTSL